MKIITSRNNKDFYDYLSGVYGIDDNIVFDRREVTILNKLDSPFFSTGKTDTDTPKREPLQHYLYGWIRDRDELMGKYFDRPIGQFMHCMLEVGLYWYMFRCERYLDENEVVHIDWCLANSRRIEKDQHIGQTAITFIPDINCYCHSYKTNTVLRIIQRECKLMISNPILTGTKITSFLDADEVYIEIYAYLSSQKDIDIKDTRNDISKLEAAGFDKRTSFRNIK